MIYGDGKFTYELVDGWAKLPAGESFVDVAGVCTNPQGRVYVLSRSKWPISVFDRDGHLLSRWGNEGHSAQDRLFVAPHALAVDAQGDLYVGEVAVTHGKVDRGARALQKFARRR